MRATLKEHKKYMAGQAECGLKVGDRVEVLQKAKSHEKGWDNSWEKPMDLLVGHIGTITHISRVEILIKFYGEDITFGYPFYVLKKVKKARGTK